MNIILYSKNSLDNRNKNLHKTESKTSFIM